MTMNVISTVQREELRARIQPLLEQVEAWRKNKAPNEHMPEPLWLEATELAKVYGVSPVQGILRIDYRGLERRALGIVKPPAKAKPTRPQFMELPPMGAARRSEQTIELEDATGRRLTFKSSGSSLSEVTTLIQTLWRSTT